MKKDEILFAKVDKHAIIPSKRDEDAGYDIYPCFEDDYRVIMPHETAMVYLDALSQLYRQLLHSLPKQYRQAGAGGKALY